MPCEDCSTDDLCRCGPGEVCSVCFESREPQGSERSSSEHRDHCMTHPGSGWTDGKCCMCGITRAELEPKKPELRCTCGCPRSAHMGKPSACIPHGFHDFVCDHSTCGWKPSEEPEEPPLTPEEEEELPQDENACQDCLRGVHGPNAHREEPPPQPERRPPYAVAYSVQGHLFEVALSGDATVRAVDGALVIQHHLGPVAGIVQVLPVINKESNA